MTELTETDYPKTVDEAVERLLTKLPLKDKAAIARMTEKEVVELEFSALGLFIRTTYGLWFNETELLQSCRFLSGNDDFRKENAAGIIIMELWKRLRETHALRAVK